MNFGKIVFAQIMQYIPRREFNDIVVKYKGNYRVRSLTCYDQLLVMCLAQYADKNSLRDIEASLNALAVTHKLYHCGIGYVVPRKRHLHIKSFYGTSENAVYTQIWIAVCAFLLLAIAKKRMHIEEPSLYMISQTIGTMLFEKIPIPELFNKSINNVSKDDGQLDLFRDLKS